MSYLQYLKNKEKRAAYELALSETEYEAIIAYVALNYGINPSSLPFYGVRNLKNAPLDSIVQKVLRMPSSHDLTAITRKRLRRHVVAIASLTKKI